MRRKEKNEWERERGEECMWPSLSFLELQPEDEALEDKLDHDHIYIYKATRTWWTPIPCLVGSSRWAERCRMQIRDPPGVKSAARLGGSLAKA